MRKEILIAVIAGVVVGLAVAFGVWRANSALKIKPDNNQKKADSDVKNSLTPTIFQKPNELSITLSNIEDLDIISESPVKISGITKAEVPVVISAENEDYIFKSGKDGAFEQEVDLTAGVNQIIFKAFDLNGNSNEKKLTVVYSTEFK